ncbi:hypothetical protein GQ55_2G070400 [Panicum hallii var. hallii]|uniref:Uncharacterized protein n=1 Tax=Panicum hallii var. hallii TaxID=1504633 RepID=A0A2T7EMA3_9POAL|nr:hypothetical protein GQ55_2G070400 [Panicum hallii var. hallii]
MAPRVHLILLLAALVLLAAAAAAALVSGGHGARRHLAVADGDSEHRRLGVVERRASEAGAAAGRWSATVRKGGGGRHGGHGHGRGHGDGNGSGRGHGTPETPAVFYPRTVAGNANYHHGRSAAAMTGPGRLLAARAMLVAAAAVLLLRL